MLLQQTWVLELCTMLSIYISPDSQPELRSAVARYEVLPQLNIHPAKHSCSFSRCDMFQRVPSRLQSLVRLRQKQHHRAFPKGNYNNCYPGAWKGRSVSTMIHTLPNEEKDCGQRELISFRKNGLGRMTGRFSSWPQAGACPSIHRSSQAVTNYSSCSDGKYLDFGDSYKLVSGTPLSGSSFPVGRSWNILTNQSVCLEHLQAYSFYPVLSSHCWIVLVWHRPVVCWSGGQQSRSGSWIEHLLTSGWQWSQGIWWLWNPTFL